MREKIYSKMMKRAVGQLFDYEVERNGAVSSHSQLERWIISKLKNYTPCDCPKSLQWVMSEIRGIEFDIDAPTSDDDVKEVPVGEVMASWYGTHGFVDSSTGGGCDAYMKVFEDDSHMMVTELGGCNIPAHSMQPISLGFYADDNPDPIFYREYESSHKMFNDEMFKVLSKSKMVKS
jgi:hypothetical protein